MQRQVYDLSLTVPLEGEGGELYLFLHLLPMVWAIFIISRRLHIVSKRQHIAHKLQDSPSAMQAFRNRRAPEFIFVDAESEEFRRRNKVGSRVKALNMPACS